MNPLNENFDKKEFQELWGRIQPKAAYTVHFETAELIDKCVSALDAELKVAPLQYTVQRGRRRTPQPMKHCKNGDGFSRRRRNVYADYDPFNPPCRYDLLAGSPRKPNYPRHHRAILQRINFARHSPVQRQTRRISSRRPHDSSTSKRPR